MKWFPLISVLLALVACDDSSTGDSDNPASWDCVEAWTAAFTDCGELFTAGADDPNGQAEINCSKDETQYHYGQMAEDCIVPNWPDCETIDNCLSS